MSISLGTFFHIGNKKRTFRASMRALSVAQQRLPGWMTVPKALERLDVGVVCVLAGALLVDEDKSIEASDISGWLDGEPELFNPLTEVVLNEIKKGYERTMTAEQRKKMAEKIAEEEERLKALGGERPEGESPLSDGPTAQE